MFFNFEIKITFIILLIFFVFASLFSAEPILKKKMEMTKKGWEDFNFEFYISPVVMPDVGIGLSKCSKLKKLYYEGTLFIHADLFPNYLLPNLKIKDNEDFYKIYKWGIKYKCGYFSKNDRSGFNYFFNLGFESLNTILPLDPGGDSGIFDYNWYVFPDLAVGCGYSWKLKDGHYFRISADIGLKLVISNLYFSYAW